MTLASGARPHPLRIPRGKQGVVVTDYSRLVVCANERQLSHLSQFSTVPRGKGNRHDRWCNGYDFVGYYAFLIERNYPVGDLHVYLRAGTVTGDASTDFLRTGIQCRGSIELVRDAFNGEDYTAVASAEQQYQTLVAAVHHTSLRVWVRIRQVQLPATEEIRA